jgi:hypothetical protein
MPGRDGSATALVPPAPYRNPNGQPARQAYAPPPSLTRRMKMALAAGGVGLFAAVATIAILKGVSGDASAPGSAGAPPELKVASPPPAVAEPSRDAKAVRPADTSDTIKPTAARPPVSATSATVPLKADPRPEPKPAPIVTPIVPPTTPPPPNAAPPSDKAATATSAEVAAPPRERPKPDKQQGSASTAAVARVDKSRRNERNDRSDRNDKKVEKRSAASKSDADKIEIEPQPSRRHGGKSLLDVKNEAAVLYRRKDFTGAAAIVTAAVPSTTGVDAQELKTIAAIYQQLGKSYNVGMAPGTKPTDGFVALRRAISYDREVGAAYVNEMQEKLVVIAARAAMLYMASKDYESAFQAVRASDALGSQSPSNKTVRDKLDSVAADLYRTAQSEMANDAEAAKQKLRQILNIVEAKNPLYAKASRLLNGP